LNKRILEILEQDNRVSPKDIATMLDLTEDEVIDQIAQMEEQGIIVKYHALVNWEKVDDDLVEAMIAVQVEPERDVGFDDIAERIYNFPEVRALYLMSGSYDLSVFVEGRDIREVAHFVSTKLATIDRVKSTVTYFVLKKYKQEGVILDGKTKPKRMAVSP
jgi:DNA-binding Lrp family transcriptional regulator